jgi:hypothetical protein
LLVLLVHCLLALSVAATGWAVAARVASSFWLGLFRLLWEFVPLASFDSKGACSFFSVHICIYFDLLVLQLCFILSINFLHLIKKRKSGV